MTSILKRFKKDLQVKRARKSSEQLIRSNQEKIIALAEEENQIRLDPKPLLRRGSIEHYFHFVFDLLMPISLILPKVPQEVTFYVYPFGVLEGILNRLFEGRVKVANPNEEVRVTDLVGMNPLMADLSLFPISKLKQTVFQDLSLEESSNPHRVLLIERTTPSEYYQSEARSKGGGSSRRSIVNHTELQESMANAINDNFEFMSLRLEETSFEDQVRYFNSAALVIAQHGAGLANILWMQPGTCVVEIGLEAKVHFQRLSVALGINYHMLNFSHPHVIIDVEDFINRMKSNEDLRSFITH